MSKKSNKLDIKKCTFCGEAESKKGLFKLCARCQLTSYCGKECQFADWKNHKSKCIAVEKRRPSSTNHRNISSNSTKSNIPTDTARYYESCSSSLSSTSTSVCVICLVPVTQSTCCLLPCSHKFHSACITSLRSQASDSQLLPVCPLCRADLPPGPEQSFIEGLRYYHEYVSLNASSNADSQIVVQTNLLKQAMQLWVCAAGEGNVMSQLHLGTLFAQGFYETKDGDHHDGNNKKFTQSYEEALIWYTKAADQGHREAQFNMAILYAKGQGVATKRYDKAAEWYLKAANQGHAGAQLNLGLLYMNGHGVKQNQKKAIEYWTKAAHQGEVIAQYNLGRAYRAGKGVKQSDEKALEYLKLAGLENHHPGALYTLSELFSDDEGMIKKNVALAADYCLKAAHQNHPEAMCRYGYLCKTGLGVPQSDVNAFHWFEKAAALNVVEAKFNLGKLYELQQGEGQRMRTHIYKKIGVEKNPMKMAVFWYSQAAEQGHAESQCMLACLYGRGEGVEKCDQKAFEWFEKAALQSDSDAQNNLGSMYRLGVGVEQSNEKAGEWFLKSAMQGNVQGQINLASLYEEGYIGKSARDSIGDSVGRGVGSDTGGGKGGGITSSLTVVKESDKQAHKWYLKAALQGSSDAQYALGCLYETGRLSGVRKGEHKDSSRLHANLSTHDKTQALIWFRKAAAQGDRDALEKLKLLQP